MKERKSFIVILTFILLFLSLNASFGRIYFYDVFGHWAEDSIMWGANTVKLLNGYEDGSFNPDGNISRAEYVSLLYRTAKKQNILDEKPIVNDNVIYLDLNNKFWAYDHISKVISYVNSKNYYVRFEDIFPGDNFYPNRSITREEAAVLTYFFTTSPIEEGIISFSDIDFDYKYLNQILAMVKNEIIFGYPDGTFRPLNNITRSEAATIIKRLYKDMEYQKKSYLGDIKLIESDEKTAYFPLFGDYANRKLDTKDLLYKRAVETLEYKSIIGIIPYEERHLYDQDPIKTIEELKKNNYHNIIGMNYYLIEYGSNIYSNKSELIDEIFSSYANGASISEDEVMLIFKKFSFQAKKADVLLKALQRWENSQQNEEIKNNVVFMKSKIYVEKGNIKEVLKLYENLSSSDPDIRTIQIMNRCYLLIFLNEYDIAEKVLREGWEEVKRLDDYKIKSGQYDEQFRGALKEIIKLSQNKND